MIIINNNSKETFKGHFFYSFMKTSSLLLNANVSVVNPLLPENNLFLAWAWLAKPKAIVIVYQLFRPCHAFTEITEKKNRGKVRTTACKAYQCASKKARGNKNIFSVEHDS